MRVVFVVCCALVLAFPLRGESELFGRVLEEVVCEADATQRYALYVPSGYAPQKKWPVIFCFDPSARGKIPVERLQAAAEKYGYVVVGSLNSRNGPYAANAAATQAMVKDVSAHFSIDAQRIYTAGMSGGARVATGLALSGLAKGVIACGAGFPVLPGGIPKEVNFAFWGAAGTEDFNYAELRRLDDELAERKKTHRIVFFEGGHEWASAELLSNAVEWLELQAMHTGTRPRDDALVDRWWRARTEELPAQRGLERWRALKSLVADFAGFAEARDFESEAKELGASAEMKKALKAERALAFEEERLLAQLGETALESQVRKEKLATRLRQRADGAEDSMERRMVRRVIASFSSMTRETVRGLWEERDYPKAAGMLEMADALRPGQTRTLYDLARARALLGENEPALVALEKAVGAGFDDADRVEKEPDFAKLRRAPRFKALLVKMREEPPQTTMELPAMRVSAVLASVQLRLFYLPKAGGEAESLSFLKVEQVRAKSAAARAGIERGMEITAIQGKRVRGWTEAELNDAMAELVRNEFVLTVRGSAGEKGREVRVALRPADRG